MVVARKFERNTVLKGPQILVHVAGSEAFLNQKEIIMLEDIKNKCIININKDEVYISSCNMVD